MPYKDPEQQRRYQRERAARLKAEWLDENGPCASCGGTDRLEVDHVDPAQKTAHNFWTWSTRRRVEELAKCQVLCHDCHLEKTARWRRAAVEHGASCYHLGCPCEVGREYTRRKKRESRERLKQRTVA